MGKFQPGDKVRIDGILMVIGSWPDDNEGPFLATYTNNQGGKVQVTKWAGQVDLDTDPLHESSTVDLVEAGDGVVSTAPSLDDVLADPYGEDDAAEAAAK